MPDYILSWIEHGVRVLFRPKFLDLVCLLNRVHGATEHNFVDNEIKHLLKEGAIIECEFQPPYVLPIQCVPKKNKKLRMVLDCRYVNWFITTPKFKQEGINSVAEQIQEGDQLISVDLENGFHHVDMHVSCWQYFDMCWRGKILHVGGDSVWYVCLTMDF